MRKSLSHVRPPGCTGGSSIDHSIQGALRDWMARPPSGMKERKMATPPRCFTAATAHVPRQLSAWSEKAVTLTCAHRIRPVHG